MRLCRYEYQGKTAAGFYDEAGVIPVASALRAFSAGTGNPLNTSSSDDLLEFLPGGAAYAAARDVAAWLDASPQARELRLGFSQDLRLLVPVPHPNKLFLLAGNYAAHIEEGGGITAERAETFPYVFMKPPSTTLTNPGVAIRIPQVSPAAIDWELELAVIIGRGGKGIREADALSCVAGYTIINDISDRKFRPNPGRTTRDRDKFFDWLHGKWHDSFCPCGPCIVSADAIPDPQQLELELRVNGQVRQHASTAHQIFPVAAVIEFISSFVTLEPGDMISTGTPAGVGSSTGTFLAPGDRVEGRIQSIGTLVSPVVAGRD